MKINNAEFITSSVKNDQCPKPDKPEYAFIGRSNVGKSSLINMLTGRRKLAKVSGSPGKTITINHFLVDETWYIVDLPGYGFAKRSKSERA
ncbi:MAG TPA: ribosome biogenesis GTP-binding protein YihA/YsxC, partial [Bacteroidales bacterium]